MYIIRDVRVIEWDCRYIQQDHLKLALQGTKCDTSDAVHQNRTSHNRRIWIELERGQNITVHHGWLNDQPSWFDDFEPFDSFKIQCRLQPVRKLSEPNGQFPEVFGVTHYHQGTFS
ncbi:hypothetical protein DICA3_F12024 [Diutina catenulata]